MRSCLICFRRAVVLLATLVAGLGILPFFAACGRPTPPPTAGEVLASLCKALEESPGVSPPGVSYHRGVDPADPGYLTDTLLTALYGQSVAGLFKAGDGTPGGVAGGTDGAAPGSLPEGTTPATSDAAGGDTAPPVNDVAVFLASVAYPCELAVFRCSDARGTATAAGVCRARLDAIIQAYADTPEADVARRGVVTIRGSYVLLVVADDPERLLSHAGV